MRTLRELAVEMSRKSRRALVGALAVLACACGDGDGGGSTTYVAVLSAFPAELAPLLEQATVEETVTIEERRFRVGVLGGVPVVLGLAGIGLVNAAETTRAVLDRFDVAGVVMSGVAGSPLRIGDVAVPAAWTLADTASYPAHAAWLGLAGEIAAPGAVALERCTRVPADASGDLVCLPHEPAIVVGGVGTSSDTFGGMPFPCRAGAGDVFGCDVDDLITSPAPHVRTSARPHVRTSAPPHLRTAGAAAPAAATDMETAAVAREAAARGLPFIAFRAVSDGAGDPLGLPGFPAQFYAYYHLAARNAAAAAIAFLERTTRRSTSAGPAY